ncbi:MAG: PEP-CTERM sorting domain-containing protein [Puniceicoccales bacterium]|jgi:hypothetical protein|nr:PEP-CTERM sorting domain-containing protein [Puniceicoccales bacterium]
MKKLLLISASVLSLAASANAAMVLVNFGQAWASVSNPGSGATDTPTAYNYFAQTGRADVSGVTGLLYDINGAATSYTISAAVTGGNPGNPQTGYGAGLAIGADTNAMAAWNAYTGMTDANIIGQYGLVGCTSVSVTLSGLIKDQSYSIFLLCGNSGDGNNNQKTVTITGVNTLDAYSMFVTNGVGSVSTLVGDLTPTVGSDSLAAKGFYGSSVSELQGFTRLDFVASDTDVTVTYSGTATKASIQAIGIEAIPEPSTYALAGGVLALGVALAVRRRKHS